MVKLANYSSNANPIMVQSNYITGKFIMSSSKHTSHSQRLGDAKKLI